MRTRVVGYRSGMDDEIPPVAGTREESLLETVTGRLREMPVGTLDPNIIGDVGPFDIPPGGDPPDPDLAEPDPLEPDTGAAID